MDLEVGHGLLRAAQPMRVPKEIVFKLGRQEGEKSWRLLEAIPQSCMCKCRVRRGGDVEYLRAPINYSLYLHDKPVLSL